MTHDATLPILLEQDGLAGAIVTTRVDPTGTTCVFHSAQGIPRAAPSEPLQAWCRKAWGATGFEVQSHRSARLARQTTLEGLRDLFGPGEVAHDPTRLIDRSAGLVKLAKSLRQGLPDLIAKLGFESTRQTLYIALKDSDRDVAATRATMLAITAIVGNWRKLVQPDFTFAIRVGFALPHGVDLVAVDKASLDPTPLSKLWGWGASLRKSLGLAAFFGFGTLAGAAMAAPHFPPLPKAQIGTQAPLAPPALAEAGAQDFWADPTLSLLGVPEVARPLATVQALRRAQATEWLVNAVDAPKPALAPMDIRFFIRDDLVALNGGGVLTLAPTAPRNLTWQRALGGLDGLVLAQAVPSDEANTAFQMWFRSLFRNRLPETAQVQLSRDAVQGYTI